MGRRLGRFLGRNKWLNISVLGNFFPPSQPSRARAISRERADARGSNHHSFFGRWEGFIQPIDIRSFIPSISTFPPKMALGRWEGIGLPAWRSAGAGGGSNKLITGYSLSGRYGLDLGSDAGAGRRNFRGSGARWAAGSGRGVPGGENGGNLRFLGPALCALEMELSKRGVQPGLRPAFDVSARQVSRLNAVPGSIVQGEGGTPPNAAIDLPCSFAQAPFRVSIRPHAPVCCRRDGRDGRQIRKLQMGPGARVASIGGRRGRRGPTRVQSGRGYEDGRSPVTVKWSRLGAGAAHVKG